MEDNAVAAFGVGPGNGAFFVADEITRTTFEAVFVVKQNATIAGWNKKICGASHDTFTSCATTTRIAIDGDVCPFVNTEFGRFDTFLERHLGPSGIALNVAGCT